mmetsp:Transcript_46111/g.73887  ORF Transcript_46111/g.73887 Transcript_46111/m.73887 type:complete len:557 (-) Transcript_46111:316-1986(-)
MALSSAQIWRNKLIVGSTVFVTCRGTVTEVDKSTNKILIRYDGFANEGWWERNAKHLTEQSAVDAQQKMTQVRLSFLNVQKQLEEKDKIIQQCNQQLRTERAQYKKLEESCNKMQQQVKEHATTSHDVSDEIRKLKEQLARYKANETYTKDQVMVILLCTSKPKHLIKPRSEVDAEQKAIYQTIAKHEKTMALWDKFTAAMTEHYAECKKGIESEEKKDNSNTSGLLAYFVQNKLKWQQQQNNMELVTEHLKELYMKQRQLKSAISVHSQTATQKMVEYKKILNEYEKSKAKRIQLEAELKQMLKALNAECDTENKLNETQCSLLDDYHTLDVELAKFNSLLDKCKIQIHKYRDFDPLNEKIIDEMQEYFDMKWRQYMKVWWKWDAESIICWIKYLREKKQLVLSYEVDLQKILQQMQNDGVNGNSMLTIDKEDLRTIGFEILNDRKEVCDEIRKLVSRYPHPSTVSDDKSNLDANGRSKVPPEFLCPLSNEVMKNPVQIFDGYTYEQSEIEAYLNEHKKSPTTNEPCDEDDICFTPNRKLKQKIDAFLSVNPQYN